jgi:hypothetical protein
VSVKVFAGVVMNSKFWVRSVVAVVFCSSIYAVHALHRNSYCFAEHRFVSEEESLLVGVMTKMLGVSYDYPMRQPENISAAKKILSDNPHCCRLLSGAEEEKILSTYYDIFDRFFGYASRIVLVKYPKPQPSNDGALQSIWIVPITSCGLRQTHIWDY